MARETRSPSPVGSTHSSSKRSRRNEDYLDRSRRDDGRGHRRSRSPPRRHRDRDWDRHRDRDRDRDRDRVRDRERGRDRERDRDTYRKSDRSVDRRDYRDDVRDDTSYRPSRRDRSRPRYHSRDREDGREYRHRSRDRRRRDDSADSKSIAKRNESRDRVSSKDSIGKSREVSKPSTPAPPIAQTDEEKKAERLAKLEAWKQKQAAEKERKQKELAAAGGARSILAEIDKRSTLRQAGVSQETPAPQESESASAKKFDPKTITKNAATQPERLSLLGNDVAVPNTTTSSEVAGRNGADSTRIAPLKPQGNVSGFGFGAKSAAELEKTSHKRALDFGDEESSRKKLMKLPDPSLEDNDTPNGTVNGAEEEEDDDGDIDMQDGGTEEENAAAARAAAEKREERLQNQTVALESQPEQQPETLETDQNGSAEPMDVEDEEEIDPLDAFMSGLKDSVTVDASKYRKNVSKPKQEPEAIFGDEDDVDLKAMDFEADDFLAITSKTRKKKDLPTVNHEKIDYEPFRKSFYTEPVDLAELNDEEVAALRLELDGIKVRGVDVPKPVQKWSQCGLGVQTLDVIRKLGYEQPTSIQSQAIPAIMSGRDVIGVAKTGSGKTIAFLLPMFRHIKDQRPLENMEGPVGLIMTPTRELATQIHKECKPFLKALNLRAVCAYGGAPIKDQIAELKRGAEIIVCTPGRMIDLLAANSGRVTNLRRVTYVVLDEADRMFDMGFEPQVMKIISNIRPSRQTVLFSATFPRNMEALARKTLTKPVEIIVGGRSVVAQEITQIVEVRPENTKFVRLLELLGNLYSDDNNEDARALIFVDRQEAADGLLRDLMRKGYPCMSIHGGKDQVDRDSTIDDFKAGIFPVLIATSVAARGLDVKQLKLVINYDAPNHLEDYVHRAGRTGRAGNTGTAVTFLTEEQERYSVDIAKALKQSGQSVPEAVQKMVDSFLEKVKSGKEKASASGFGGKGLERLDQERDAARNRERKTYKTGEEGEEDEEKEKKEKDKGEELFAKAASAVQSSSAPTPSATPGVPKGIDLDGKITVHKTERATPSTTGTNPLDKVGSAVADIHARLNKAGVMRSGVPIDNKGPDAGAFHATLEINDFPQKARWAVTNRTNVAKILEATGTSITTKGSYYPPGKEPGPNENPKLYILVEGDTELVVTNAMRELMRLLKEGTIAAADSEARAPASGRYNVL
ncbi:pre-mRNA-processing ATP-dependent RNA helicase PRP5, putative [Coccidioides posadasii C735 delta SOWgp]|nr:pre-mRNA-processing ATP-dependent RNA helicase PRP5, putative [Coccidioides posadasii C735 delta SOWgp]EER30064.1 pre-mRNA-processing ATP-dependent RNA helicase PRP5, putative [Coccidioides posadasii C735 delta SOWgp]|eukprot:XP_003072209.1 pre-mRNA-processing ATP-dependent RNA helicase PRP5, putative [Coccidioides posadasii C735 delta SOWgp]